MRGVLQKATPLVRVEFSHLRLVSSVESATGMMCVRVAPPAHTGEQVRVSPKCGEKLKWGFESPTAPKKKLKKVLDKSLNV